MSESAATTLTECQHYWLDHVRSCEASGRSIVEYAADQGIDGKAMYAGRRRWSTQFQRAQVVGPVVGSEWRI